MRTGFCVLFCLFVFIPFVHAQETLQSFMPGKHRGEVTAVLRNGDEVISAGEDGFLAIWNIRQKRAVFRFQISPYRIDALALRPGKNELCVSESGETGVYRISAWNYAEGKKLFSVTCNDPARFLDYSAGGGFIIAAQRGSAGILLLDPETGETLKSFETLGGMASFAATGRAERNMLACLVSGAILYLDLEDQKETSRFSAPAGIEKPLLFGNNRFFAGINSGGLVVFDAASGAVLDRDSSVRSGLLCPAEDGFYCLNRNASGAELRRYAIDRQGRLAIRERASLPAGHAISAMADGLAFGADDGAVLILEKGGRLTEMAHNEQIPVSAIAATDAGIAFVSGGGAAGFLPLDYRQLTEEIIITAADTGAGYDSVCPFPQGTGGESRFLLWKNNAALPPAIFRGGGAPVPLRDISPRFPLRAVSVLNGNILLLDSRGNVSVYRAEAGGPPIFSMNAAGALDAAFANPEAVILSRPAFSGNTPFLVVNINTGETLPLALPFRAGLGVFRGASGKLYGVAAGSDGGGIKTLLLRLNAFTNSAGSSRTEELAGFSGEDADVSVAESAGIPASTLGGEGAALYTGEGPVQFERGSGLPVQLAGGGGYFISLDSEGSICWHDNQNGKLLALLRLYPDRWMLEKDGIIIRGAGRLRI